MKTPSSRIMKGLSNNNNDNNNNIMIIIIIVIIIIIIINEIKYCALELLEGRLALNPGLNLTRISFSCVQKRFLG